MPKLTLSVDAAVLERVKACAEARGMSVSRLAETLLEMVVSPPKSGSRPSVLSQLRGSMLHGSLADYRNYLEQKHR